MKLKRSLLFLFLLLTSSLIFAQNERNTEFRKTYDSLGYNKIVTDNNGNILPWYSKKLGESYDFVIKLLWSFWDTMRADINGIPYYMNHQVWKNGENDPRGIGGDQFSMALSSWKLLYAYCGNEHVKENMKFIADYYLTHALSPATAAWPNIPYPYNTLLYSGFYDGDMILGKNFTQPDKAGNFGYELTQLYEISHNHVYLDYAILIANTLVSKIQPGDADNSPLPFRVNAITGEVGKLYGIQKGDSGTCSYTSNFSGTLLLFEELIKLNAGNTESYKMGFTTLIKWMKNYPLKLHKWGPFFEDVAIWSDTQTNAVTFAFFILQHRDLFPDWKKEVKGILDWVYDKLGNNMWNNLGVKVINEQTVYLVPGNSHTSRQASTELWYASLSEDTVMKINAIRQLNWATYMVNKDGRNCYPWDEVWLTDGYGDYIRHYLRAMAADPMLAPDNQNHVLWSTSVICQVNYAPDINKFLVPNVPFNLAKDALIYYETFENESIETIRMTSKPSKVLLNGKEIHENQLQTAEGWHWKLAGKGGVLKVDHKNGNKIIILR